MDAEELRRTRVRFELEQAERRFRTDPAERRLIVHAVLAALAIHVVVLAVRAPGIGAAPERVEAPQQVMQVRFLRPPPPPPPKQEAPPPEPPPEKRVPRPDPEPSEPEPIAPPPPPEPAPEPVAVEPGPPLPPAPEATGPVRVEPDRGPGLIRKVEPAYPHVARIGRIEGKVVLDAVIRKDGTVAEITVLAAAHPLLARAAQAALAQWLFTPSDGDVIMMLTVNFVLHE